MDDGKTESDNDNNDSVWGTHGPREPMGGCAPEVPLGPMATVDPAFMNFHVKCPIFSAQDDENAESHPCVVMSGWIHKALQKI